MIVIAFSQLVHISIPRSQKTFSSFHSIFLLCWGLGRPRNHFQAVWPVLWLRLLNSAVNCEEKKKWNKFLLLVVNKWRHHSERGKKKKELNTAKQLSAKYKREKNKELPRWELCVQSNCLDGFAFFFFLKENKKGGGGQLVVSAPLFFFYSSSFIWC